MKKEEGSILLLTVIAIAFVTVLSTALLSMTSMNVGMKYTDKTVKSNVYAAESGIEEAYAIVGKQVEQVLLKAEGEMETQITGIDTQAKAVIAQINAVPRLSDGDLDLAVLKTIQVSETLPLADPGPDTAEEVGYTLNEFYNTYLTPDLGLKSDVVQAHIKSAYESTFDAEWMEVCNGISTGVKLEDMLELDPAIGSTYYSFVKPGTKIEVDPILTVTEPGIETGTTITKHRIPITSYFVADGVERVIEATIEIQKPDGNYPVQIQEKRYIDNPMWQYALIAKDTLAAVNGSSANVEGKIYSQGANTNQVAVSVADAQLRLTGDIVTEGDIITNGTGAVKSQLHANNANVYCRSLMTQEGSIDSFIEVKNSFLYTKDDIELNGAASDVDIIGRYIGFSDGSAVGANSHDKSSAIVINTDDIGTASSLTMQKSSPGITFGGYMSEALKTKVDTAGIIVPGTAWIDGTAEGDKYQTGESVSVKGNYVAYGNFFDTPDSKYDKDSIYTTDVLGMDFVKGYMLADGSKVPYTVDDKEAYFKAFYDKRYKLEPDKFFTFNPGKGIHINNSDYTYTLGTSMTNHASGDSIHLGVSGIDGVDMKLIIDQISRNYEHMSHYLTYRDEDTTLGEITCGTCGAADGPIEHYVEALESQSIVDGDTILYSYEGTNPVTISNGVLDGVDINNDTGVIMVGGDLNISGNLTFSGSIIAGGKIILGSGTHNIKNNATSQNIVKELVNKPGNAKYQAQFKNSRSYQSTTTVQPGGEGMSAYRYNDIVRVADWKQR